MRQAALQATGGVNVVTLGLAPLGGSLCIVASACRSKIAIGMSRTGWTVIGGPLAVAAVDTLQFMWRVAVAGDPAAIAVSYDDTPDVSLIAAEFTGSWGANPVLPGMVGTAIGSGAPFQTVRSLTPPANKSALFILAGLLGDGSNTPPMFAANGLTDTVTSFPHLPVNGHPDLGMGYQVIPITTGAAVAPRFDNSTGDAWGAYAAVFAESPGGSFAGEPGGGVW